MRQIATAVVVCGIIACGASTSPDLTSSAGNYSLRSINDSVLPFTVQTRADYRLEITSDTIRMALNGEFTDVTHYRETSGTAIGYPADSLGGAWTIQGQTVLFTATTGDIFNGNLSGSTLTIIGSAYKAIYSK